MSPITLAIASCVLGAFTLISFRNLLTMKERQDEREKGIVIKEKALEEKDQKLNLRELELITNEVTQKRSRIYRIPNTTIRIVKFDGALFMMRDDQNEVITLTEESMAEVNLNGNMNEKMQKLYENSLNR